MGFEVGADAYATFMGRYSEPLATRFAEVCAPVRGERALDVGCGPGALTAVLVDRLGAERVAAVDPSSSFVAAVHARLPGVEVHEAGAETLPFDDARFDLVTAQLVVHFLTDPVASLRELARVTRPGGRVAACVWDFAGDRAPLSVFWRAVRELDSDHAGESARPGAAEGELRDLFVRAGLTPTVDTALTVRQTFADVDAWWETLTHGVGPVGDHLAALDDDARQHLREHCATVVGPGEVEVVASAWTVVATRST